MEYMLQEYARMGIMAQIKNVSGWSTLQVYPQVCGETKLYQIGEGYGHVFSAALVKQLIFEDGQLTIVLK